MDYMINFEKNGAPKFDLWWVGLVATLSFTVNANAANQLGLSDLQADTSASVRTTCAGLAGQRSRNVLENDLFDACRSMVQSENQLLGTGPTSFSRDLTEVGLGSGLQNIATEETLSPVRIGVNTTSGQISTVATRITVLRGGAGGLATNGFGNSKGYASLKGFGLGGAAGDADSLGAGALSGFFNTFGGIGDTEQTATEDGSDFYNVGFTVGLDYRVLDNLILGLAGGYSHLDLDFDRNINVGGGSVESDSYGLTAYGTYYIGGFYVDGMFNYGWANFDLDRNILINSNNPGVPIISRTAVADPDGDQWTLSLQTGYNFDHGALSYGPYARIHYRQVQTDSYTESGAGGLNLAIQEQTAISLQSIFGAQVSYNWSQSFGVLVPFLRFDWHHEFKDNSRALVGQYVSDPRGTSLVAFSSGPDEDYFALNAGISGVFANGIQAYFNYNSILGHDLISGHLFSIGARMNF